MGNTGRRINPMVGTNNFAVRISDDLKLLAEETAKGKGMSLSDYIRSLIVEALEDEYDLKAYQQAFAEFKKDPKTYTFEEAMEILENGQEI